QPMAVDISQKFAVHGKNTGNRANARGELTKKSPFRLGFGAGSLKPDNKELQTSEQGRFSAITRNGSAALAIFLAGGTTGQIARPAQTARPTTFEAIRRPSPSNSRRSSW